MILDLAFAVLGIVVGAIAISTTVRLINGESWESANKFRAGERAIILLGYFTLGVLFALSADVGFAFLIVLLAPAMLYMISTSTSEPPPNPPSPSDAP